MFIIDYLRKSSTLCYNIFMQTLFLIMLFIIGSAIGSFLCCQARRLRLRTSRSGKGKTALGSRSICLHCHYQLRWYDNIPLVSWLLLRGKCRKCHANIGIAEPLSELGMGLSLLAIGTTIDIATAPVLSWGIFIVAALFTFVLGFLAIYDGLYGELPTMCLTISIICAILLLTLREWASLSITPFSPENILYPLGSVLVLGGLYLLLYLVSKGKWVGDGDWLLGTAIGLALGSPWLALIALFITNMSACIVMIPFLKAHHTKKIYLGPFMVLAFVITFTFADFFTSLLG